MYSTRGALALLWRGAIGDQSGIQLWSDDERHVASILQRAKLGDHVLRETLVDGKLVRAHFFVLNDSGWNLWQKLLLELEEKVEGERHERELAGQV